MPARRVVYLLLHQLFFVSIKYTVTVLAPPWHRILAPYFGLSLPLQKLPPQKRQDRRSSGLKTDGGKTSFTDVRDSVEKGMPPAQIAEAQRWLGSGNQINWSRLCTPANMIYECGHIQNPQKVQKPQFPSLEPFEPFAQERFRIFFDHRSWQG